MGYDLNDKTIFITGASSGIGRACALEYHAAGSRVVATARSTGKLEALARQLGRERLLPVTMDVTDPAQRDAALHRAREQFGQIDVLVNNAGWASFASVARLPLEHLDRMLALNFAAPVALIQAVLPEMRECGSGQIVNIASVVGYQVIPNMTVYSATKAACHQLGRIASLELAEFGIRVNMVAPDGVFSEGKYKSGEN